MQKLDIIRRKILSGKDLERWLHIARFRNRKIVFTNGCFDVLHRGHVEYLAKAAESGDLLVVGLNTDASVKKIKGPLRPYQDEKTRALILASLRFVSAVVLFNEETPYDLIGLVKPAILVKGGDYKPEEIVGYDLVKNGGGEVITIALTEGYSSTPIIDKISGKP
ncbi:MAG TPA: D-glycero-beta-D-manno-heptose 1-phosphate adenylyltransferase [Bacteroidales bacterium]|nr:D-glycero-beta-D-manno-heptose 1-phosphate adenylyltransferase [Bacteroidales bacterium]